MDTKPQPVVRVYEDYQPLLDWVEAENEDNVRLQLPGFKKEQLKVQLDNYGTLKLSGERLIQGSTNKWQRFRKEFQVPNNSNFKEIRAKFEKDTLYVTIPKMKEMPTQNAQDEPQIKDQETRDSKRVVSYREDEDEGAERESSGYKTRVGLMLGLEKWPMVMRFAVTLMVGLALGVFLASTFKTHIDMETD